MVNKILIVKRKKVLRSKQVSVSLSVISLCKSVIQCQGHAYTSAFLSRKRTGYEMNRFWSLNLKDCLSNIGENIQMHAVSRIWFVIE